MNRTLSFASRRLAIAGLFLLFSLCGNKSFADATNFLRVVAVSGTNAPIPGAVFAGFTSTPIQSFYAATPQLNNAGQVAFLANLQPGAGGVDSTNDQAIWSEASGSLSLVAREGDQAASAPPGARYSSFSASSPFINSVGQIAFSAVLAQGSGGVTTANDRAVLSDVGGTLQIKLRSGDAGPPFLSPTVLTSVGLSDFNNAGQLLVGGSFPPDPTDPNVKGATWLLSPNGSTDVVLLSNQQAPGLAAGRRFWSGSTPALSNGGQSVMYRLVTDTLGFPDDYSGIWVKRAGSLQKVAAANEHAPGTDGDFGEFPFNPSVSGAGHVAFSASIQSGPGYRNGIWSDVGGSLHAVAVIDGQAPELDPSVKFKLLSDPVLNDDDRIVFVAGLQQGGVPVPGGIWTDASGSLRMIVRAGDQAPGAAPGVVFRNFQLNNAVVPQVMINNTGQIAFAATLRDVAGDVTTTNDQGLWAQDQFGQFQLIARTGNTIDVDTGPGLDLRTISSLSFFPGDTSSFGRHQGFNDLGQFAFLAAFADGSSGIFVSNAAAVPEPCAVAMAGLLLIPVMMTARSRKGSA